MNMLCHGLGDVVEALVRVHDLDDRQGAQEEENDLGQKGNMHRKPFKCLKWNNHTLE